MLFHRPQISVCDASTEAQLYVHRVRTLRGLGGPRVSHRRRHEREGRRSSRDGLTRCVEVDLVEETVRVSLVASCGLGVGLALGAVSRR